MSIFLEQKHSFLMNSLNNLNNDLSKDNYNDVLEKATSYFSTFEDEIIEKSTKKGKLEIIEQDSILGTIESVFDLALDYFPSMRKISSKIGCPFVTPDHFLSMSQRVYKNYRKKEAKKYKEKFKMSDLPTEGFERKGIPLRENKEAKIGFVIGIAISLFSIIIPFVVREFTGPQYLIFRASMSLGFAFIAGSILRGVIEIKFEIPKLIVSASGAIAFVIIFYFFDPAPSPEGNKEPSPQVTQIEQEYSDK